MDSLHRELLKVENLSVDFATKQGTVHAVRDISFQINTREIIGVVGESGSGKSVSMLAIMNLLADNATVTSGKIRFEGQDLSPAGLTTKAQKNAHEKQMMDISGKQIGMVFQDPMSSLNPVYKVGDQVAEGLLQHNKGMTKKEARQKVLEIFNKLGIPDPEERINSYPHQFSGGMKQRVVIAIAMICNPELIICDEPTTALDVTIQAQIMELLKSMQMQEGKSIVLITHNMGLVAEMADEVCVMYMGRIVEFGTLEDIFDRTSHPYTKALLRSVPVLGLADGQKLETIPGSTPNPADLKGGCEFADRCDQCCDECREKDIPLFEVSSGHHVRCLKYKDYPEVN